MIHNKLSITSTLAIMFCLLLITTPKDANICGTICSSTKWEPKFFKFFLFFVFGWSSLAPHCQVTIPTHPLRLDTELWQPSTCVPLPPSSDVLASPTCSCSICYLLNSNPVHSTHFPKVYFALYLFSVGHFINRNSRAAVPNPENTHFLPSKPQLASSNRLCVA